MKKITNVCFLVVFCFVFSICAQIPIPTLVQISKAEDELRYDKTLEDLMKNADAKIRARAALAAGRIGDETAISALVQILENDKAIGTQATAIFALGEIESINAADAILTVLRNASNADSLRARATEAAGKIAAANAKNEKAKVLGEAILDVLEAEDRRGKQQNRETVLLGLTAALRARPEETDFTVAKFLTNLDARIRADAANTLSRVRVKNANEKLRAMLLTDSDAVARANAARALGAAEDAGAFDILMESALTDEDSRVRVSAIRSLGSLELIKNPAESSFGKPSNLKTADKLLERAEKLLSIYRSSRFANPVEKSELLEIAAVLGRILPNSNYKRAEIFLTDFANAEDFVSPEIQIALARISPSIFLKIIPQSMLRNISPPRPFSLSELANSKSNNLYSNSRNLYWIARTQGLREFANLDASNPQHAEVRKGLQNYIENQIKRAKMKQAEDDNLSYLLPENLRAYSAFKPDNLDGILQAEVTHKDLFIRATAAELLGDLDANKENVSALVNSFPMTKNDKLNDAALAILDALEKQYKKLPSGDASVNAILKTFEMALDSPDYLVRRKTIAILKNLQLTEKVPPSFQRARFPLNNNAPGEFRTVRADYVRAVSRKNGTIKAILTTEKGNFTIDFFPEDAPLTVDNFVRLARAKYFDGLAIHRVVPNFVMQDGDPRGNGNGGPGWQIRCELNMRPFERGAVGMALSGKDTGGSQWFAAHSPQPHLDGGYTVFGKVNEIDMKIVDNLVRGDKILKVQIVENVSRESAKTRRKK